ncbi:MAG: type II toxin-antitoxin system prevent-host-death family antitoxin [Oscillospiraceae bacterium]|nr:type II toxin-antitoxin system prevent-host-death family antitoxin [Oscillospiraceae bacterium]
MIATNYTSFRTNLKDYCDKATNDREPVIVTRKSNKNVVVISLDMYNNMMKAIRNAEYLNMIDLSIAQLEAGKGKQHDLIEVDDE